MGSTEIDPPSAIRVGESPAGRGVFAVRDIAAGETIELCPILRLGNEESGGVLSEYVLDPGDGGPGAVLMLGYGSLYNHSDDANAEYIAEEEDAYAFVATRDISADEQVTIDYGRDWWETRELEPESL